MPLRPRFFWQTTVPVLVAVLLFAASIYLIALPALEKNLLELRRENIRDLTRVAWSLLAEYDQRVRSGELTLAEAQARAAARLRIMRYGADNKDYFWISDRQPRLLMHPYRTDLEGQDVSGWQDRTGRNLFVEFVSAVADSGEGYVDYFWQYHDQLDRIEPKVAFVKEFAPWAWIVGTGMYVDDVHARIAVVSDRLRWALGVILSAFLVLNVYILWRSRRTEMARVDAVDARERSEAQYRSLVETITDWVWEIDARGCYTFSSPAVENLLGYRPDEVLGRAYFEFMAPEEATRARAVVAEAVAAGGRFDRFENACLHKDGHPVVMETSAAPILAASGDVIGFRGVDRDISTRKQAEQRLVLLEERLHQSQKMEAIGRLAGGIAHDFNNLLTAINGYAELLSDSVPAPSPQRADLEEIRRATGRAAELTGQLLSFSRKQLIAPQALCLNDVVAQAQRLLSRIIGEDIELVFTLASDLWTVQADAGQIEQVLLNLAANARDAMPGGGRLVIETMNVMLDADYARIHPEARAGDYVMVAVSDNGVGIDAATRARIFEPFFTTKAMGQGTGLGLATVYGIVGQSGGHIGVYSEPSVGSTFKIYLPRVFGAPAAEVPPVAAALRGGQETILVAEDEEALRRLAARILERHGYVVLQAGSGEDAIAISRAHAGRIDLLLTDVVIPDMNGRDLHAAVAGFRPGLRVIFMSGYTNNVIAHHGVLDQGTNFLPKPFTADQVARKVRQVLDDPSLPI